MTKMSEALFKGTNTPHVCDWKFKSYHQQTWRYHARLKWCGELKECEILSVPPEQPLIRSPKKFRRIVQSIWASHLPRCNLETCVGWVWVKDPPPMAKRPTGVSTIEKKALQKKEDVWEASRTRRKINNAIHTWTNPKKWDLGVTSWIELLASQLPSLSRLSQEVW